MNRPNLYQHPAMDLIRKSVIREIRQQLLMCFLLLLTGLVLVIFTFGKGVILPALGLSIGVISVNLIFKFALKLKLDEPKLIQMLRNNPQEVVWVYTMVTQRLPFGLSFMRSGLLYFKLANGDEITISLPCAKLKMVSKYLNRLLPHATFGYSPENAKSFHKSPENLRKSQLDRL